MKIEITLPRITRVKTQFEKAQAKGVPAKNSKTRRMIAGTKAQAGKLRKNVGAGIAALGRSIEGSK